MRRTLQAIEDEVERIDTDNLYRAVADLKQVIYKLLEQLEIALPMEVEPD